MMPQNTASDSLGLASPGVARYFAYGMNMDVDAMVHRCPTPELLGPASLPSYRFVINARGVATVVPAPDSAVHGLLWELCDADLNALDRFEGVEAGHYRRGSADVVTSHARDRAVIYIASDATPGAPRPGYLERVVAAATVHAFPANYIEELRQWLPRA